MPIEAAKLVESSSPADFRPEKAHLDLTAVRTQFVLGVLLTLLACFACYWSSLKIGFLLDDFLHVDYVARAAGGHWRDFLENFTGNWADSDIMRSYRPFVSSSLFIDYLLWGPHAAGFHLTNILIFLACCLLVGLITLELTGSYGNRLGAGPAIWAALLFAVYPLHPETVSWVIGRVDLLCTLFYLGAVFAYLRFRLIREETYLFGSLVCFLLALISKEMAVTLPVVIGLAELCLFSRSGNQPADRFLRISAAASFRYVACFFVVLAVYAIYRSLLLGAVVGGYGNEDALGLLHSWRNFLDKPTLTKIFLPLNEEVHLSALVLRFLVASYLGIATLWGIRLLLGSARLRPILFLALWAGAALAPAYQIWHIYPNLGGSRLFFLSSAPFCILLVLAALPAAATLSKRAALIHLFMGTLLIAGLFVGWSLLLKANLRPWISAGQQMATLRSQLSALTTNLPPDKQILLLNLPRDFSGAGMLTRPQYLSIIARPPFARKDVSSKLLTIEPLISGCHDFLWSGQFRRLIDSPNLAGVYIWDPRPGRFTAWSRPTGDESYEFKAGAGTVKELAPEPKTALFGSADRWKLMSWQKPCIIQYPGFLRIYPGTTGLTIFLPAVNLNPLKAQVATVEISARSVTGCHTCLGKKLMLAWQSSNGGSLGAPSWGITGDHSTLSMAEIHDGARGRYTVWLGRYRSWALGGTVKRLGLRLEPGDYLADFAGLLIKPDSGLVPQVKVENPEKATPSPTNPDQPWLVEVKPDQLVRLAYDASKISGTRSIRLVVTKSGTTFDVSSEPQVASLLPSDGLVSPLAEIEARSTTGTITLPAESLQSPGVHQARVVALDSAGSFVGLPSEPISVIVKKK